MRFTKPTKVIGLDIGSQSVKAVQMTKSGNRMKIEAAGIGTIDRNEAAMDPVAAASVGVRNALHGMAVSQSMVVGALPGQSVVIRYPRLRGVAAGQIEQAVEVEASQNIPYDLAEVNLDWSLLEEEEADGERQLKVLLVAAKHEVIDSRVQVADASEIEFTVLSVDSLSLADAAEACDYFRVGETCALINIGSTGVSIHFAKDGISNFIRDVNWGARDLVQAIAKAKRCEFEEAEAILGNLESELGPRRDAPAAVIADDPDPIASDAPSIDAGLTDDPLGLDAEPSSGSGSLLDPLADELETVTESASASVSRSSADSAGADLREALSSPISKLVNEIRRSFDYYEHQLYERPVDRIILSGGAAHLTVLREAIQDDLGIDAVEVADPRHGSIVLSGNSEHVIESALPSRFMVAVGLGARGLAEL